MEEIKELIKTIGIYIIVPLSGGLVSFFFNKKYIEKINKKFDNITNDIQKIKNTEEYSGSIDI